jgi:uncharacterized membrane protein
VQTDNLLHAVIGSGVFRIPETHDDSRLEVVTLRPTVSAVVGLFVAFLTWFLIGNHVRYLNSDSSLVVYLGWTFIFITPGSLVAIMFSGNVHSFETWAAALANFVLYFALVFGVLTIRQRWRASRRAKP